MIAMHAISLIAASWLVVALLGSGDVCSAQGRPRLSGPGADRASHSIGSEQRVSGFSLSWRRRGAEDDTVIVQPIVHAVDGDVVLAFDAGSASILRMDARSGTIERVAARKGSGPGELLDVHGIVFVADRVVALDRGNSALKLFDRKGRYLGEHQGNVAGAGSSCAIGERSIAIASLGRNEIEFIDTTGATIGQIRQLIPEAEPVDALLRLPLLTKSPVAGRCVAVRPYGGLLIEFDQRGARSTRQLYSERRKVQVQRKAATAARGAVRTIRGAPTLEDVCTTGSHLLVLRASSLKSKVIDVFEAGTWRHVGAHLIDPATLTITCNERWLIAKEYRDGLLGFAGYQISR